MTMTTTPTLDRAKLKALVHYLCWRCGGKRGLGFAKLSLTLWQADMTAYLELGQPITGETYIKAPSGPFPSHVLSVLEELGREGQIVLRETGRRRALTEGPAATDCPQPS